MNKYNIFLFTIACLFLPLLMGCYQGDDGVRPTENPDQIAFDCNIAQSTTPKRAPAATRTTYPTSGNGSLTTETLKNKGFGVFSQHSGNTLWASSDKTLPFNFMWNQEVEWDNGGNVWTYEPVKYWPNDNQPADDEGAMGSQEHSYLSFFGYAPYQEADPSSGWDRTGMVDDDGIVKMTTSNSNSGTSYLTYRTSHTAPFDPVTSVDLLWASQQDLWKMKSTGEGYTTGRVHLLFKHALSKFSIAVQGLFDHASNSDTSPQYPSDVDANTRIFVESVDFSTSPLFTEGDMYFAPRPDDAQVPYWEVNNSTKATLSVKDYDINALFRNHYMDGTDKQYGKDVKSSDYFAAIYATTTEAQDAFKALPKGVTHTEQPLFNDKDFYYLVLPNKQYITDHPDNPMKVHMVYYVITFDPNLVLNTPRYFSIVKNDITATFSSAFAFEPNKQYKFVLQPGLTTVKFKVEVAEGWDVPVVMDPVVMDWKIETKEYNVE